MKKNARLNIVHFLAFLFGVDFCGLYDLRSKIEEISGPTFPQKTFNGIFK